MAGEKTDELLMRAKMPLHFVAGFEPFSTYCLLPEVLRYRSYKSMNAFRRSHYEFSCTCKIYGRQRNVCSGSAHFRSPTASEKPELFVCNLHTPPANHWGIF